jgi:PAS domain S-box-containing protein
VIGETIVRDLPILERLYLSPNLIRPGSVSAYLSAGVIIVLATALRMAVDAYVSGIQFIFLSLGIMLATFICGVRAGSFAGVLAILAAWFFVLPTRYSFRFEDQAQVNNLLSFVMVAAMDVAVVGLLRTTLRYARELRSFDVAIFNANPDAVIVSDAAGRIVRANERAALLFGYSRDALIGHPVEMLIPDRFRSTHVAHRAGFAADPRAREMGAGLELLACRSNGEEFPVDVQIGPAEQDGALRVIVSIRDITAQRLAATALTESRKQQTILEERQRGAEELRQANAKLAKIIESAPVAIWAIGADERITIWNPAVANLYGISSADAIGKSWRALPSGRVPSDALSSESLIGAAFEQDGFKDVMVRRLAIDGSERELSMSSAVLRDAHGQPTAVLYIAHDVSATRELERKLRQAQKMEVVGQLTGGVAHDFNNLLAVIFGNLEMLGERSEADPESLDLVHEALSAAEHGAALTQQLLAFSRLQQLTPTAVDIGALLSSTVEMLKRTIEESVAITTAIAPDLWRSRIDSGQLANALLNLVVNARDAMPSGGRVTIAAENAVLDEDYCRQYDEVAPGQYIKLSIADTGVGMPKAILDRATEPFFTTKAVGKGSGLGLSQVFGFLKQSGGHLSIYSEQGLGTTASLYLPRLADDAAAAIQVEKPMPVSGAQQVILVVEDNEALRKLQIRMITSLGYRILEAGDGTSALQILDAAPHIDLLLTDIVLPGGISGPDIAEAARKHRSTLKVIFMSGYAPRDVLQNHDLADAQCLTKPFTRSALARALQNELAELPPAGNRAP